MHNHIDTRARPADSCPACAKLWKILEVVQPHYNLQYELETARVYFEDYGEQEMLQQLTTTREKAQYVKAQLDRKTDYDG